MELLSIAKKYKHILLLVFLSSSFIIIATLFIPIYLGLCFKAIEVNKGINTKVLMMLILLYVIRLAFKMTRNQLTLYLGTRFINDVRHTFLANLINSYNTKKYEKHEVFTILSYDVNVFSEILSWKSAVFFEELLILVFSCFQMFSISPWNSVVIMLSLVFLCFLYVKCSNAVQDDAKNIRQNITNMTKATFANFTGQNVLRSFNAQKWQMHELNRINNENFELNTKLIDKNSKYLPMIEFLGYFIVIINIFICSFFVMKGALSLTALVTINGYAFFLISTVKILIVLSTCFVSSRVSFTRIAKLFNDNRYKKNEGACISLKEKISTMGLENVDYQYNDNMVLNHINLTFNKGSIYQIKGEIGSGKTTLLNILSGLDQTFNGKISVNNIDIRNINAKDYLRRVAYVGSEPAFFNLSMKENLTLGDANIQENEIYDAISFVKLEQMVGMLGEGLDTQISKDYVFLSGGEKQRLALARAILKKPDILLIDDAINAIDEDTLASILNNLKTLKDTIIIITSNLSSVTEYADAVFCLVDGGIQ